MKRMVLGNAMQGSVQIAGQTVSGSFTPTVFCTENEVFGTSTMQNVLGVIHHSEDRETGEGKETEHALHTVARAFSGKPMETLGPRWIAFISALLSTNQLVTGELAREAWFATNREPNELTHSATERGCKAMTEVLPGELVERIRSMTPGSQA